MSAVSQVLFTPADQIDVARILSTWDWLLRKPYRLLGLSAFGDVFLHDADGSIKMLNLVACEVDVIATCLEEFEWGLGDAAHQEEWLLAELCRRARDAGLCPGRGQCLAFRTPPILGGSLTPDNLIVWDLWAYYDGLAQLLPQVLDLPLGSKVVIKPSN